MSDYVTNLRFTVVCRCSDPTRIPAVIDCFNEVVYSIDRDILYSAHCSVNRLEDDDYDC